MKKYVLALAALAEAGTGVILVAYPPIVVRLLFGVEISGPGVIMSRIIALIGLGVACWPGNSAVQQLYGMLTCSTLAMLYLIIVGLGGQTGILLWPAVIAHGGLAIVLVWVHSTQRKAHLSVGSIWMGNREECEDSAPSPNFVIARLELLTYGYAHRSELLPKLASGR